MTEIKYVSDEALEISRDIEQALQQVPQNMGILFVSARAIPELMGAVRSYDIKVGISRVIDESAGHALIAHVLKDWVSKGLTIHVAVYQGVATQISSIN